VEHSERIEELGGWAVVYDGSKRGKRMKTSLGWNDNEAESFKNADTFLSKNQVTSVWTYEAYRGV
jgi:hypothetical protein